MNAIEYDIVVATRNRLEYLKLAFPTFLGQTRPPQRLIVADASDDHEPVRRLVEEVTSRCDVQGIVLHCLPSSSAQRNQGMQHVTAPVVMFPDDDVLWYRDAAEHLLRVYESDPGQRIGGVGFREAHMPPERVAKVAGGSNRRSAGHRLMQRLGPLKVFVERRLAPDPIELAGLALLADRDLPRLPPGLRARPVHAMLGFLMTFRSDPVRRLRFNETLTRYALYEDYDLSLGVLRDHLLFEAEEARVFHYRAGGRRGKPREMGTILLLNLAYVTCRHAPFGSPARRSIRRQARLRLVQYFLRRQGTFGRERFRGAICAYRRLEEILSASPEELDDRYRAVFAACTAQAPGALGNRG